MKINNTAVFFSLSLILHLLLLGFGLTWKPHAHLSFQANSPLTAAVATYLTPYSPQQDGSGSLPLHALSRGWHKTVLNSAHKTRYDTYNLPRATEKRTRVKKTALSNRAPPASRTTANQTSTPNPADKTQDSSRTAELLRLLYMAIAKQQRYPQGFQESSVSVRVAFKVHPDGSITHVVLDKSSRHDHFDLAALQAVAAASPVHTLVGKLQQPTDFRIEIIFANA